MKPPSPKQVKTVATLIFVGGVVLAVVIVVKIARRK